MAARSLSIEPGNPVAPSRYSVTHFPESSRGPTSEESCKHDPEEMS